MTPELIWIAIGAAAGLIIGSMTTVLIMRRPKPDPAPWSISEYYPTEHDERPRAVVRLTSRGQTTEI